MKQKVSILLMVIVCFTFVLTSCDKPEQNVIQTLTAEQTVLKVLDGVRDESKYKTIDGTLSINMEDRDENTYAKYKSEQSFKGVIENRKLNADITTYIEGSYPDYSYDFSDTPENFYNQKTLYLDYIRANQVDNHFGYAQRAEVSTISDGNTVYDAANKESLSAKAKETMLDNYSCWSVPEYIADFVNGVDDYNAPGMFDVIDCLKKTRKGSATLENNIAKWLVNLWEIKATREKKNYVVTIDANKAIDKTIEFLDGVVDYAVKHKDSTLNYIFEEENSPIRLFFTTMLYGVTAKEAEKMIIDLRFLAERDTDYDKFYNECLESFEQQGIESAGDDETAYAYLKRLILDGNSWGADTLDYCVLRQISFVTDLFYSYDEDGLVLDLAGWKKLKETLKNAIGKDFYIYFNLTPDFIVESIKFDGKWQQYFTAAVNCEIYFNRDVAITDLSEYFVDYKAIPSGATIVESDRYLGNAYFESNVNDGEISLAMYLDDGTKLFEKALPAVFEKRGQNIYIDINTETPITDENGETVLSDGQSVRVSLYLDYDNYINVSVIIVQEYIAVYCAKFECTLKKVRFKEYNLQ